MKKSWALLRRWSFPIGCGTKLKIKIALVNRNSFSSGGIETALVETETEISGTDRIELYTRATQALRQKNIPSSSDVTTAFKNQYRINYISEADGEVTVDFSSRKLTGSLREEQLLIAQIVATLTGSFEEVDRVLFTVDGEPAETLMGHVSTACSFSSPGEAEIRI